MPIAHHYARPIMADGVRTDVHGRCIFFYSTRKNVATFWSTSWATVC